jgi:hypothetical protein
LPLADEVAQFVAGHVHSVERSTAETSFNVFNLQFHFSPGLIISKVIMRAKICKIKLSRITPEKKI